MIATAEKALCDKLAFTKNLGISSQKAMKAYIEEDLRIDLDELKSFDLSIIKECAKCGYKSGVLTYLYKTIKKLQEHS
jgi:RNase P/RNase MRP subunit p30